MRYIYDLHLSSGDFVPELGFGRLLGTGDEFDLYGARWRVRSVGPPTREGVRHELLVDPVDSPTATATAAEDELA